MSDQGKQDESSGAKPKGGAELQEGQLEEAAGGFNPQPDPQKETADPYDDT